MPTPNATDDTEVVPPLPATGDTPERGETACSRSNPQVGRTPAKVVPPPIHPRCQPVSEMRHPDPKPMNDVFLIREFDREKDYPMLQGWAEGHGRTAPPLAVLPRLGVVAFLASTRDDMAALWLYMDNSVGVCFAEHAFTRPGLSTSAARRALVTALDFLKQQAARMDYGVMVSHTVPAIARTLKKAGFRTTSTGLECLFSLTR